jgi:hypothetical protein
MSALASLISRSRSGIRIVCVLLGMTVLLGCTGSKNTKPEGPPLSGAEITKLLVGNSATGAVGAHLFTFYYKDPEKVSGVIGAGDNDSGTWKIKNGDTYCHDWIDFFDGVERCYQWHKSEDGYTLVNVDAYHLRPLIVNKIQKGNPLGF